MVAAPAGTSTRACAPSPETSSPSSRRRRSARAFLNGEGFGGLRQQTHTRDAATLAGNPRSAAEPPTRHRRYARRRQSPAAGIGTCVREPDRLACVGRVLRRTSYLLALSTCWSGRRAVRRSERRRHASPRGEQLFLLS